MVGRKEQKKKKKLFPCIIDEALRLRHRASCQKIWFSIFCVNFCLLVCFLICQFTSGQLLVITKDSQAVAKCIPLSVRRVNNSSKCVTAMRLCEFRVSQVLGKATILESIKYINENGSISVRQCMFYPLITYEMCSFCHWTPNLCLHSESQNSWGWKQHLKVMLPMPLLKGHLGQATKNPIQTILEYPQGWSLHSLSG